MAKAKAKSKNTKLGNLPPQHPYLYTFDELRWGERMLHYIANDLESDYNKLASMHTYLLTKQDLPDLFNAFYRWIKALSDQYQLKDAMGIFNKRYRDCMNSRDPFNESQGEMMRLAFHATFPGKTMEDVLHFQQYCVDIQFGDGSGNLVSTYFDCGTDEEAFDAALQAYLDQDDGLSADQFWKPIALKFVSDSGTHVSLSKDFFDHANGLVDPPPPQTQRRPTRKPPQPAKPKLPKLPVDAQDSDDDDDDSTSALAQQIINLCNALKDDIDVGDLGELAKELTTNE